MSTPSVLVRSGERPASPIVVDHRKAAPAHLIEIEADAHATVVELYDDLRAAPELATEVRVRLAPGSSLTHVRIVTQRHAGAITEHLVADVQEGAHYKQRALFAPAHALHSTQALRLCGPRAEASVHGGLVAHPEAAVELKLEADHLADDSRSDQRLHALGAGGRTLVDSEVKVAAGRRGVRSRQSLRGLHAAGQCDIALRPRLAVHSQGVDCRHGATTCAVSADQLHFLRSRGLGEAEALQMLSLAHLQQLFPPGDACCEPLLRDYLPAALAGLAPVAP